MATTEPSLREHTKSKSSMLCTARVCMPQMIAFVFCKGERGQGGKLFRLAKKGGLLMSLVGLDGGGGVCTDGSQRLTFMPPGRRKLAVVTFGSGMSGTSLRPMAMATMAVMCVSGPNTCTGTPRVRP
ncbi:unnamed protein product, partial [Ixodes pacificus]